jgi:hypothetical protein
VDIVALFFNRVLGAVEKFAVLSSQKKKRRSFAALRMTAGVAEN